MAIDFAKSLNQEQFKVVMQSDGPCLVLAGAGSGKTRTLVYRVAYLLEKGVAPENILLVTFTNKAANEMMTRITELVGELPQKICGGTFHHIANHILRKFAPKLGYTSNFIILDEEDSAKMVKAAMQELNINTQGRVFPKPAIVHKIISFSANTDENIEEITLDRFGYTQEIAQVMRMIKEQYELKKKQSNSMDFDDLLTNWLKLLTDFPEVKEKYSRQFQYILVDEYQDTNFIQAEIIKLLSEFHHNVLVVGDDSQSIYSFRAADVSNILNFPKNFPSCQLFRIETNYRSTPQILNLANDIIKKNVEQYEKTLVAKRQGGILPSLIPCRDVHHQASMVCKRIMELHQTGLNYNQMAVLYRANYQSAEIQMELAKRSIPFVVRGGLRYFEQAHIKDVVAHLKVLANLHDEMSWKRIMQMHPGLGEKKADYLWKTILDINDFDQLQKAELKLTGQAKESWLFVLDLFSRLLVIDLNQRGNLAECIRIILAAFYENHLRNSYENFRERLEDCQQLMNFVALYSSLEQLLSDVTLNEDYAKGENIVKDAVILSTIHQAKGLEWSVVFIVGLRDGEFPHYKCAQNEKELEEERRLFYVAATRAKDELNMLFPVRSFSYQYGEMYSKPSMFIAQVDKSKYSMLSNFHFREYNDDGEEIIEAEF